MIDEYIVYHINIYHPISKYLNMDPMKNASKIPPTSICGVTIDFYWFYIFWDAFIIDMVFSFCWMIAYSSLISFSIFFFFSSSSSSSSSGCCSTICNAYETGGLVKVWGRGFFYYFGSSITWMADVLYELVKLWFNYYSSYFPTSLCTISAFGSLMAIQMIDFFFCNLSRWNSLAVIIYSVGMA